MRILGSMRMWGRGVGYRDEGGEVEKFSKGTFGWSRHKYGERGILPADLERGNEDSYIIVKINVFCACT